MPHGLQEDDHDAILHLQWYKPVFHLEMLLYTTKALLSVSGVITSCNFARSSCNVSCFNGPK